MNQPWSYMCSPSRSPLPPPSPPDPSGSSSALGPSTCLMHPTWAGDLFHPGSYTCFDAVLSKHPTLTKMFECELHIKLQGILYKGRYFTCTFHKIDHYNHFFKLIFFSFWRYFHYIWKLPEATWASGRLSKQEAICSKTWNEYVFSFCVSGHFIKKVVGPRNWWCHAESVQAGNLCTERTCQGPVQTGLWRAVFSHGEGRARLLCLVFR